MGDEKTWGVHLAIAGSAGPAGCVNHVHLTGITFIDREDGDGWRMRFAVRTALSGGTLIPEECSSNG
ncbi:hypothetical protein LFML04_1312 [Leptospirillum ferriphilum ML-04]|uniref:Uncharacterized protein n=1 Tax=Leptospirillum ferriphilum (strain ML-04) TaxID=1048260 RepID=J9ZCR9_LEPFM|nr:hypothetical protein LFML04_1312 [Leptospirillum ferriphilum ML-04]